MKYEEGSSYMDYDAATAHRRCFDIILVNAFGFSPARAHILAELQSQRALKNWAFAHEDVVFWILDAITDSAWQDAMDWELEEDVRHMFQDAIHGQERGYALDPSYDWVTAKKRCSRIIEECNIKIVDSHSALETWPFF